MSLVELCNSVDKLMRLLRVIGELQVFQVDGAASDEHGFAIPHLHTSLFLTAFNHSPVDLDPCTRCPVNTKDLTHKVVIEVTGFPFAHHQGSQDTAHWHDWWNQLSGVQRQLILLMSMVDDVWSSLTEGQKTVTGIIAVNAVVLCLWRMPSMQRSMIKYFTSNPASKTRCLPMVLSSFSHYSFIHMVANMYVLWTFSSGIVSLLGREQFLAVYLSAGVISTMVSYMCKTASGRLYPSLGAVRYLLKSSYSLTRQRYNNSSALIPRLV
ncbi:hypothetical protein F2P81_000626 [Scophthalmus maximus]|uniref:rhomboid protease n=1 Tax=Scophthalmus maximus TaxID=52904 RepID=A0A6A4TLK6_SCOMX|nr:hypothetical protein F2P81_000626 [Scophthalmus maximus]